MAETKINGSWACGTRFCEADPRNQYKEISRIRNAWRLYLGKYEEPTPHEAMLIEAFITKYVYEAEDYDEDCEGWKGFKKRYGHLTRDDMFKLLDEVRGSKGYEVTVTVPDSGLYPVKVPSNAKEEYYDLMMEAVERLIIEINHQTGKKYEMVGVEKLVLALPEILITLSVKEVKEEDVAEHLTVRGIVILITGYSMLLEWKLKSGDSWISKRVNRACGCIECYE